VERTLGCALRVGAVLASGRPGTTIARRCELGGQAAQWQPEEMLVSMGGPLSARSRDPRRRETNSRTEYKSEFLSTVTKEWQTDVLSRLQRIDKKLDVLETTTRAAVRAPMSPLPPTLPLRKPKNPTFSDQLAAEELVQPPETAVPLVPLPADKVIISDRSLFAVPLPVGDHLAVEAPTMDWGPARSEEMPQIAMKTGTSRATPEGRGRAMDVVASSCSAASPHSPTRSKAQGRVSVASVEEVKAKNERQRSRLRETLWNVLDDPESGRLAALYAGVMPYIIIFSVGIAILQTPSPPVVQGALVITCDILVDVIFLLEFVLRAASCPAKRVFFYNYHNTIDLLAAAPLVMRATVRLELRESPECGQVCTVLMCYVPAVRALKALRRFEALQLIINASQKASEGLPVCLYALFVLTLLFASLIYIVEPRDNIDSLPDAMWLTIVTMTTVGYGDVTPSTLAGSMIVSVLAVCSVLYMAMPLGIVGNAFTEVWQDRDFILLRHRTKTKLQQWGYGPQDVPTLFELFDEDQDGELNMAEFVTMMDEIRIGLIPKRVLQLFETLDADGGGTIDDKEFIRCVFPEVFNSMYAAHSEAPDEGEDLPEAVSPPTRS